MDTEDAGPSGPQLALRGSSMQDFCARDDFRCVAHSVADLGDGLRALTQNAVPAIVVRDFLQAADAEAITRAFLEHPAVRTRADGVAGRVLGAYHYKQSRDSYVEEAQRTRGALADVLEKNSDPVARLDEQITNALCAGDPARNRPARWLGEPVATTRMSSWLPSGEYLLRAHDDIGQLRDPAQVGFEPQQVPDVGAYAVNLYVSSPAQGGALRLWNAVSDTATRRQLDMETSGYPYPESVLQGHDSIEIQPRSGDLVLINGAIPHAVTLYESDEPRVALNYFFAPLGDSVIRWV